MTGASPDFPPYFEEIDSVMGTRDCVTLPEVKARGIDCSSSHGYSSSTSKCEETDMESDKHLTR